MLQIYRKFKTRVPWSKIRYLGKAGIALWVTTQWFGLSGIAQNLTPETVVADAARQLIGKAFKLRHLVAQSTVKYDEEGYLLGKQEPGDWTLHSHLQITDIKYKNQTIYIAGNRVILAFEKGNGSTVYVPSAKRIEIQIKTPGTGPFELEKELRKAFLSSTEGFPENLPAHWDRFVRCGRNPPEDCSSRPAGSVVGDNVREPRLKDAPSPSYTDDARAMRLEGQVRLRALVDQTGRVFHIEIVEPLGLGLDERAVQAVRRWKFDPGTRDGEPVPVFVDVYVNFSFK
jgi:TonB family protein